MMKLPSNIQFLSADLTTLNAAVLVQTWVLYYTSITDQFLDFCMPTYVFSSLLLQRSTDHATHCNFLNTRFAGEDMARSHYSVDSHHNSSSCMSLRAVLSFWRAANQQRTELVYVTIRSVMHIDQVETDKSIVSIPRQHLKFEL